MWYKIKQGRHRAYPLSLGIHTGKTKESYEVIFDDSCRYELDSENQEDWNKLVGWSYGLHQQNSIRIAWRYVLKEDKIQVSLYIYDSEIRKTRESRFLLELNKKYKLSILKMDSTEGEAFFLINGNDVVFIPISMIPKWGYNLGCYFGGSMESPKDMKIWLRKI